MLIDYNDMSSKFPTVTGDYDDFDDFTPVCHFGGRAEAEKHDPENYPWIEFQKIWEYLLHYLNKHES